MCERDRTKLRDIVGRIQVIREELRQLEAADEVIIRQVAHSAGHALNWIALVICPRNNISYKPAIAASQALLILRNTSVPLARHT
jgi:uncharacterized protein (DUF3084 family)